MGIAGLLKNLKSITKRVHVKDYNGLRVGIDAYCWLHRGSYSCSREITEGIRTEKFVDFFMEMIDMLLTNGLHPIVVFDGRPLPMKSETNVARGTVKRTNKEMARKAAENGNHGEALILYQRSVSITPEMVYQVINVLKSRNIEYMVSAYESDAQLAYLSMKNMIDLVITEDSDVLVFGCKRVLFKLNKDGHGEEINRRDLGENRSLSFLNWTDDQFKLMCCLSGCDYAPKIKNLGIVTAYNYVNDYKSFDAVMTALMNSKYKDVTFEYILEVS
jgi:exonuclease-1